MNKFQTHFSWKATIFSASFLGMMALVFVACRQDSYNLNTEPKNLETEVELAKVWFANFEQTKIAKETQDFKMMQPQWDFAFVTKRGIEVPFSINGKMSKVSIKDVTSERGRQRLVFVKKNNDFEVKIETYMPSMTFKGSLSRVHSDNLFDNKFSGVVSFRRLKNPDIISFLDYENGKITKTRVGEIVKTGVLTQRGCLEYMEYCYTWCQYTSVGGEIIPGSYFCDPPKCKEVCIKWASPTGEEGGDDGGNGGNGCNSPDCDNDPCSGPNPPSSCNNNGGDNGGDGDPCDGPNPPDYCGCHCSNQPVDAVSQLVAFSSNTVSVGTALIEVGAHYSVSDCSTPTYQTSLLTNILYNNAGSFTTTYQLIDFVAHVQNEAKDPKCGFTVAHQVLGTMRWSGTDNFGTPLSLDESFNAKAIGNLK